MLYLKCQFWYWKVPTEIAKHFIDDKAETFQTWTVNNVQRKPNFNRDVLPIRFTEALFTKISIEASTWNSDNGFHKTGSRLFPTFRRKTGNGFGLIRTLSDEPSHKIQNAFGPRFPTDFYCLVRCVQPFLIKQTKVLFRRCGFVWLNFVGNTIF